MDSYYRNERDERDVDDTPKRSSLWRRVGLLVTVFAALIVGAGVADVVFTYMTFCQSDTPPYSLSKCKNDTAGYYENTLMFTFISAGIWGAIPTFMTGIFAIQLAKDLNEKKQRKRFVYSALSTSLLVLPGMITVAALEAYYATQEEDGDIIFSLTGSNTTSNTVKFALPIVYGLLGIFEFLLIGLLLIKYYSKRPEDTMDEVEAEKFAEYGEYAPYDGPYGRPYGGEYGGGPYRPPRPAPYPRFPVPKPPPPPPPPPPPRPRMPYAWPYTRPYQPQVQRPLAYYPNYFGNRAGGYSGGYGNYGAY